MTLNKFYNFSKHVVLKIVRMSKERKRKMNGCALVCFKKDNHCTSIFAEDFSRYGVSFDDMTKMVFSANQVREPRT